MVDFHLLKRLKTYDDVPKCSEIFRVVSHPGLNTGMTGYPGWDCHPVTPSLIPGFPGLRVTYLKYSTCTTWYNMYVHTSRTDCSDGMLHTIPMIKIRLFYVGFTPIKDKIFANASIPFNL